MEKYNQLINKVLQNKNVGENFKARFIELLDKSLNDKTPISLREAFFEEAQGVWEKQLEIENRKKCHQENCEQFKKNSQRLHISLKQLENNTSLLLKTTAKILLAIKTPEKDTYWN
ncbi:MAG: hypothetical protein HQM15_05345 [Deltaproteobacteria bacterium]|nr:hypothetical protein [Deltaproteobacteria bacterium]